MRGARVIASREGMGKVVFEKSARFSGNKLLEAYAY